MLIGNVIHLPYHQTCLKRQVETGKKRKEIFCDIRSQEMRKATLFASGLLGGPPFLGLHDYKLFPTTLISTHLWARLTSLPKENWKIDKTDYSSIPLVSEFKVIHRLLPRYQCLKDFPVYKIHY